uniref:Oocyte zinc finger protein XlCOF6-like n=1 Tax=Sparus aurata TaxID=8175 RepID=A0A671X8L2_SPAAU
MATNISVCVSVFPSDVQQLFVIKEEVSPEWCPSQEQTDLEPLHMKEEQEEHWTSQKGEQLVGLKETDTSRFPSTAVSVKSENYEEKPQLSELHQSQTEDNREAKPPASSSTTQIKTETDEEYSGGSEPARNREPDSHPQLNTDEEGSDCSVTDVSSVFPSDVQQLFVIKEEVSPEWCPSQEQTDVEPLHMKEEQEEHWISQKGEQLVGLKETDISRLPSTAVPVKSEHYEEKPQLSELHQSQTEDNREAKPPASSSTTQIKTETEPNREADSHPQLNTDEDASDCSVTDVSSVFPSDVQQLFVIKEEVSPEWCPSQEQTDVEPLHMKEEQEEHWISQKGEQLVGLKETDMSRFPSTAVPVKSENDEEKPQLSELHQSQTEDNREAEPPASSSTTQIKSETDEEYSGGSEPTRNREPDSHQLNTDEDASDCSVTDVSSGEWQDSGPETKESDSGSEETRVPQSGLNALKHLETPVSDVGCNAGERVLKGDKLFSCDVCGKRFTVLGSLRTHTRVHTGVKPFSCDVCRKRFTQQGHLKKHMRVHTGEKPFDCVVCGKRFGDRQSLKRHTRVHTGEKPFDCVVCGKRFGERQSLRGHMSSHTGEKPFVCGVCGNRFILQGNLKRHMRVHTGEKPFSCGDCGKSFAERANLIPHMRIHTGEKPFACDVCGRRFIQQGTLKSHMRVHTGEKCL